MIVHRFFLYIAQFFSSISYLSLQKKVGEMDRGGGDGPYAPSTTWLCWYVVSARFYVVGARVSSPWVGAPKGGTDPRYGVGS